jgi:hypothetical protein
MRWIIAFLACIGIAQAQIIQHNISDDGFARVPLQFPFPLYGRIFTDSYMFSNGVVGFGSVNNSWCCSGFDLTRSQGYQFNYSIMPLQTDLINYGSGRFLTEGTPQYQRYYWENISEYGAPQNLNTFGVEIRPSGYIGMHYNQVNISSWRPVTIGVTGDTALGEFSQIYHGNGFSQANFSHIIDSTGNICASNPLSSPTCAGYQEAYLAQQCSISSLYSPSCPNYAQAYHDQQCSINPLYANTCQGYAQAYFNEQCRVNPLYDRTCSGYAEAYALANVVAPSVPVIQVSSTGSVETPTVADPVVNQVISTPSATSQTSPTSVVARQNTASQTTSQVATQPEKKEEKKEEKKDEPKSQPKIQPKTAKSEVAKDSAPVVVDRPMAQPVQILDLMFVKMVTKPIQDNGKAYYFLTKNSQIKHEEMVDEQYRKRD